jgi:integrase
MSKKERSRHDGFRTSRLGDAAYCILAAVPQPHRDAMRGFGEYAMSSALWLKMVSTAREDDLKELNTIAELLGPHAPVAALGLMTRQQWEQLHAFWPASDADWNRMRMALSSAPAELLGDETYPLRHRVIKLMPMNPEADRVPDISPAKFEEILTLIPEPLRCVFRLLALTGLRIGEYLALGPEHLRPHTNTIVVMGTKTRASQGTVYVATSHWHLVEQAVPSRFGHSWLYRVWTDACDAAGVPDARLHDLRHCHAQWAIDAGAQQVEVMASLRQASLVQTQRYAKKRSATAAGARLAAIVSTGLPGDSPQSGEEHVSSSGSTEIP